MLTGREARSLPPPVVRGLFWRIYARTLWSPALVSAAYTEIPDQAPLEVKIAKGEAARTLAAVEATLFPEDDDG